MDNISLNINKFESLLKNHATNKPLALYGSSKTKNIPKTDKISAKEVLENVSRQVKAMQNADTISSKRGSNLDSYESREFLPINRMPGYKEVQKLPTKFETQCVTDSQLINVVENAEIVDKHRGVTQEFDKTFCQKGDECDDDNDDNPHNSSKSKTSADIDETKIYTDNGKSQVIQEKINLNIKDSQIFENSELVTCEMDTVTCCRNSELNVNTSQESRGLNKCVDIIDLPDIDMERHTSPVLNTIKRNVTPPLVVDLYTFEKFEDLALPIIEEHEDLKIAKSMINSQIIGKEMSILHFLNENVGRGSPVLSKIECITTNINKDEIERICTCSSKCVDKDGQSPNDINSDDLMLNDQDKKTKSIIKDEILFSSDEEFEYLHKNVQELPLTCALETSFYDRPDVLDKTMYVGFQTASNKSIQINTDSFTKAKSLLSGINNEGSGKSLSDLVEIFDSGKYVSENEELKVKSNKPEYYITNEIPHKVDQDKNNDFTVASNNDCESSVEDALKNISLTALELYEENKDDIDISQVIQFKSISRTDKFNNSSTISDRNMSDTISAAALESNKEFDDDIVMSQVIQFKSIRTPNVDKTCTKGVDQESLLPNIVKPKRAFEGFKTASNKKIKLSDKALARCKKVFQDIDLGASEDMNDNLNIIETEEEALDNLKSIDFNITGDNLKTNSDVNSYKNISVAAEIKKASEINCDLKTVINVKEEPPKVQNLDFRINDQIILQEFEDNEMQLEETNNNAYIGFKTASNKNIAVSEDAMVATKNVFQDIITFATANDCDNPVETPENFSDVCYKNERFFKKPATDLRTIDLSETKPSVDNLEKHKYEKSYDTEIKDVENSWPNDFVGYKRVSNKDIVVFEEAKENTKGLFNDLEQIIKSKENNVKFHSNNYEKHANNIEHDFNCGIDSQDFLAEDLTHLEDLFKDNILENKNPTSPIFLGFQTASHKPIVISERALEKSKKLLEDVTNKDIGGIPYFIENKNDDKTNSEKSKDNYAGETKQITDKFNCTKNKTFLTASNKNVVVSDKATEAIKQIFQDIALSEQVNIVQIEETGDVCNLESDNNSIDYSNAPLALKNNPELNTKTPEADNKANQSLEIDLVNFISDSSTCVNTDSSKFVGFQTASAKPIHISANAMEKTKKLLSEFEFKDSDILYLKPRPSVHFQTARNKDNDDLSMSMSKHVIQSDEPLAKSAIFNEKYLEHKEETIPVFKGVQPVSNKIVNISEEAFEKSKEVFHDVDAKEPVNRNEDAFVFKGFQTASNKKVQISGTALAKSKRLFEDMNISQLGQAVETSVDIHENNSNGFQTANEKTVKVCDQAANDKAILKTNLKTEVENSTLVFKRFQTASNKKVQISETALAKSKRLFEDMNLSQLDKGAETTVDIHGNYSVGFHTANKKRVKVSDQIEKDKVILKNNLVTEIENSNLVFKGFQTASNKKVQISATALAESKRLFEDINLSQLDNVAKAMDDLQENHLLGEMAKFKNEQTDQTSSKTKNVFRDIHHEENYIATTDSAPCFKGFQTASNKKVAISEKALARSKKLFEDINLSQLDKYTKNTKDEDAVSADTLANTKNMFVNLENRADNKSTADEKHKDAVFKGFQTANNEQVAISENSLAKCRQVFEDINLSQLEYFTTTEESNVVHSTKVNHVNKKTNETVMKTNEIFETPNTKTAKPSEEGLVKKTFKDIRTKKDCNKQYNDKELRTPENKNFEVLDTQILNDFQETLNTEDFCKSTPTSKRSGSPILSCPRAKKRKFETPYRTSKKIETKTFVPPKLAKTYDFDDHYKKNKKYTLKDIEKLEKGTKLNIDTYITELNFDHLHNFEFKNKRNDYTSEKMTTEDIKKIFLGSVNKKIVPEGWLDNHIKLIIWKLISYEVKYRNAMENTCTVKNVLEQLKYRYDRELYHVERPILRKILEKDEVPSKTMVLCVAGIYMDNISVARVNPTSQNVELLLTDGWYCVKACLDRMLVKLVVTGTIVVGTKLAVCGAELMNCDQGVAPWEDTSAVRLKLHGNSVRRARWHARLGVYTDIIQCPLGTARSDGGKISATRAVVTRVYPPLYVEKMEDGSTVTLSERLEQIRQMKYESERQAVMEKLYEEVEKEMSDQDSQDSEGYSNDKLCMDSGSQISRNMKKSKDPDEYRSHLTKSQNRMLQDHDARQREKLIERVRTKFQQKLDKNGFKDRNVIPLLKVRLAGLTQKDGKVDISKGYLSIWKPSAAVLELVTEGTWIEILNVIPTGTRNSEIQLSAGRQTVFNPYKQTIEKLKLYTNTLLRKCYEIKEITQNPATTTDNNEIDTVGVIFCIEPSTKDFKEQSFQNVYLADADKNIICVNFWGGLKKFGFENVLDTGQIITCVNLQKRAGNTRKSIPQYRVTEFSYFTKTPKNKKALVITNELTGKLSKIKDKFCEDCIVLKNNYSIFKTRDDHVSPYRFTYNGSKNIVSPLQNRDTNLNLTGLDFETSFNSQEMSPQLLLRKKKVNEKIEKIRFVYGEPPPLSSIHMVNQSKNASATYKSPLISKEHSKMECPLLNVASPVTVNRTFVKNVNPVKLNFSRESLDESVDNFADDFDASPPLSLDSDLLN